MLKIPPPKKNKNKQKTTAAMPLLGHTKILHVLVGMNGSALAATRD